MSLSLVGEAYAAREAPAATMFHALNTSSEETNVLESGDRLQAVDSVRKYAARTLDLLERHWLEAYHDGMQENTSCSADPCAARDPEGRHMTARRRLAELGVTLPPAIPPAFHYASMVSSGEHAYVSGQLPKTGREQEILHTGIVPDEVSLEQAQACARLCAINALAVLEGELGEGAVDRIAQVVQVTGYVAATPSFEAHPKVIDGASTFLSEVFEERGRHARAAVGVSSLPRRAPVEIAFVVRMDSSDVRR